MATKKQLKTLDSIKNIIGKTFIGNINDGQQISNFIGKYLPLVISKKTSLVKHNKRDRYIIKNYTKW